MAMVRYATATITRPSITQTEWSGVRSAAASASKVELPPDLAERAQEFLGSFSPADYLWTHATIVCSVDTYSPKTMPPDVDASGRKVNRKYSDFRITPLTQKYINNNDDAWKREVLSKSFKTFIGGQNYCEHVQVLELSKGRIIDAVSRDLGESLYIDILIATSRTHKDLIEAIQSGKMATLSMGCNIQESQCTKCGNVAKDETEMCSCIRYDKGSFFFDELGQRHRVAELCGHDSLEPTGGVTFIEASWVENPAFKGAVLRNILQPEDTLNLEKKLAAALKQLPPQWADTERRKAASIMRVASEWDEEPAAEEPAAPAPEKKPPLKEVEDALYDDLIQTVKRRVQDDLAEKKGPADRTPTESTNENLGHLACLAPLARLGASKALLLESAADIERSLGLPVNPLVYQAAYRQAGRLISASETNAEDQRTLVRLGHLLTYLVEHPDSRGEERAWHAHD